VFIVEMGFELGKNHVDLKKCGLLHACCSVISFDLPGASEYK